MPSETTRTRGGDMPQNLQAQADGLIEEFMEMVNTAVLERHLQRGIARSQLPSSIVIILDGKNLTILGQLRTEGRFASYYHHPELALTPQQVANSAQWEFGFEDPFIIQFPVELMEESRAQRRGALERIASEHIDSEFERLMGLLGLMRTRPIFGALAPAQSIASALLLLPHDEKLGANSESIQRAANESGLVAELAEDIRGGRSSIRALWQEINKASIIIADLTGADPGVMYGLGIAHTIGKPTVLVFPRGSSYLTDVPRTFGVGYEDSDTGRAGIEGDLKDMLQSMLRPGIQ